MIVTHTLSVWSQCMEWLLTLFGMTPIFQKCDCLYKESHTNACQSQDIKIRTFESLPNLNRTLLVSHLSCGSGQIGISTTLAESTSRIVSHLVTYSAEATTTAHTCIRQAKEATAVDTLDFTEMIARWTCPLCLFFVLLVSMTQADGRDQRHHTPPDELDVTSES